MIVIVLNLAFAILTYILDKYYMEQLSSTATPKNQTNTSGGETLESKEMQQIEASELQAECETVQDSLT